MHKKTMQSGFIKAITAIILVTSFVICYISINEVNSLIRTNSETILESTADKEASIINKTFSSMRKSVAVMANFIYEGFENDEILNDENAREKHMQEAERIFSIIANNTESTVAYYFRFNHEFVGSKDGFFISKVNGGDEFVRLDTTDILLYDKNDVEHVGWYWKPIDAGGPVWMEPYYNKNNDTHMISYVIPLYKDDVLLGVVGMDFNYDELVAIVDKIKVYENGYAYLTYNGEVVHHRELKAGVTPPAENEDYKEISSSLENGMDLVLAASYKDINKSRHQILTRTISAICLLLVLVILLMMVIIKRLVLPIKKLTEETSKVANGDYNITIEKASVSEIENLGEAFKLMADKIQEHEAQQHRLAFRDSLTGLRNTNSYKSWIDDLSEEDSDKKFGLVIIDINYLKQTNDTYGHATGDKLICSVAQIISGVFKRSPVFRIGGDEFAVILLDRDLSEYQRLIEKLDEQCRTEFIKCDDKEIRISIARGYAFYEPEHDKDFVDLFNRADDAMYAHKRIVKNSSHSM